MNNTEKAKSFMYCCLGLTLLCIALGQWIPDVVAQENDTDIVGLSATTYNSYVMAVALLRNGDTYVYQLEQANFSNGDWLQKANLYTSLSTSDNASWGTVKGAYSDR